MPRLLPASLLSWLMLSANACLTPATAAADAPPSTEPSPTYPVVDLEKLEPLGDLRPLSQEIWSRKAISYSGFRAGHSPVTGVLPSRAEVLEDLRLLEKEGFGLLRVYGSGEHGRAVVELIAEHALNLKVQVGAYLSGANATKGPENLREVEGAVALARQFPRIVVGVSVGNEVLVSWSFVPVPPEEVAGWLRSVRGRITQPVTVNDNWEPYAAQPGTPRSRVWGHVDYASIHTYAYWDAGFNLWDFRQEQVPLEKRPRAMMHAAASYARKNFSAVRAALDAAGHRIPIVIGETGWQSVPSAHLNEAQVKDFAAHQAHPVNQAWYFRDMLAWAYGEDGRSHGDGFSRPAAVFYFSAFDEPWKQADDNWGLWDANRKPKFVLDPNAARESDAVCFR